MQAVDKNLLQFLEGSDKRFVIPVYQRNYDWKREQCNQLFEDIAGIVKQGQKTYFIGSIVSIQGVNPEEYVIIDGQQRLTTISLILLAIHNMLCSGEILSENPTLKDQIKNEYLVNKYSHEEKRIRLKPIKDDNQAFVKLFEANTDGVIPNSNISTNYNFFREKILSLNIKKITIDQFFSAIKVLRIVHIWLNSNDDNPQLIFESLNSTGKQLEESDLVRNYILMDKLPSDQEKLYEQFWHPIEKNTHFRVGDFIRDFLTYKRGKTPRKDRVYFEFKSFVQENSVDGSIDINLILTELLGFSKFYGYFLSFNSNYEEINACLKRIDRLQVTVAYPFMLDAFKAMNEGIIDDENLKTVLDTIEAFVVRRLICDVPTNALNKFFATLGRNIRKVPNHEKNYIEIFKFLISAGISSNKFPSDEEFAGNLVRRDIYNLKPKNKIHLYERLENFDNRERVDVEALFETPKDGLSFEHIMPQNLSQGWKKDLGDKYTQVHDQYLHTLGNVTLTAYNSGLSNSVFLEKVNKNNGFKGSRLWLNKSIAEQDKWGEEEIIERAKILAAKAVKIWGFPSTLYKPTKEIETQIGLYDEYKFTGTKPVSFVFLDQEYPVKTWRDLYIRTIELLYTLDSLRFETLLDNNKYKKYLSFSEISFRNKQKIFEKIYINTNLSAYQIVSNIKILFDEFDLDEDDFGIVLHEEDNDVTIEKLCL